MDFSVNKTTDGKKIMAEVCGPLNTNTSPILLKELEEDLENIDELVLDCKDMPYTSSAGVRVILLMLKTIEGHGTMKLINVNEEVKELLDTIGFLDMLSVE